MLTPLCQFVSHSDSNNKGKPTRPEILKWMKDLNDWFSVGEKVGETNLSFFSAVIMLAHTAPVCYTVSTPLPSVPQVGVRFSKLTGLEDKYPQDAVKAREEMVDLWLEKDPEPTWAKLADGFDHAGQRALARKIRETYNCESVKTLVNVPSHALLVYT